MIGTTGHIDAIGGKLHYWHAGSGPPMVFVHNAGSDHENWRTIGERFATTHTVYAMDMPGYGQSTTTRPQTLDLHADAVIALLDALDLTEVHLVGHCVGGAACWTAARRQPERMASLTLFSPVTLDTLRAGPVRVLYDAAQASRKLHQGTARVASAMVSNSLGRRTAIRFMFGKEGPKKPFRTHAESLLQQPDAIPVLDDLVMRFNSFSTLDEVSRPPNFPPTLLVWGTHNRVLPIRGLEAVSQHLEPDRTAIMQGRGHLCMVEAPDEIFGVMRRFISDSSSHN